jgi:hypothetical protein
MSLPVRWTQFGSAPASEWLEDAATRRGGTLIRGAASTPSPLPYAARANGSVLSPDGAMTVWLGGIMDDQQDASGLLYRRNLREYHSDVLRAPEEKFGVPHYVTVRGDTAVAMLFVRENGRQEFGAEFRGWRDDGESPGSDSRPNRRSRVGEMESTKAPGRWISRRARSHLRALRVVSARPPSCASARAGCNKVHQRPPRDVEVWRSSESHHPESADSIAGSRKGRWRALSGSSTG